MGSGTYQAIRKQLKHGSDRLRIVMTTRPEKYESEQIPGVLEFTRETPGELCNRMVNNKELLLVGGSKIYSSFMKEELIDEIYLTIEPLAFGSGKNLFAENDFDINLRLETLKKLNKKGTILLQYKVLPSGRQVIR